MGAVEGPTIRRCYPCRRSPCFDIAKSVFQVHGVDAGGEVVVRRQLKRRRALAFFQKLSPCPVDIEACASSHYWSRELQALGHTVRLMPPAYVKPYVKRQKNEGDDEQSRDDFFFGREGWPRQQLLPYDHAKLQLRDGRALQFESY